LLGKAPRPTRAFTLVELMMVVVIIGVLAVLSIYGVRKYIATAKSAEARNALGQMTKDAATAFEREKLTTAVTGSGAYTDKVRKLCASASTSVPTSIALVTGKKYQSNASDWTVDQATNAGFYCLKFSITMPQYYMYSYALTGTGATAGDSFTVSAQGDLDGNGVTSLFSIQGQINSSYVLNTSPQILEVRPDE
jgi:type IV pilus assembly protein PilA